MNMMKLNLHVPLVVAPMAGGPSSVGLVVASSQAGALGSVGAAYSSPKAIEDFVLKVRQQTKKPIAINLFIPEGDVKISQNQISKAIEATKKYRQKLNLPEPELKPPYEENFDAQFEMVLKLKPEVFSFVFGVLKPEYVKAAAKEKILLFGTATNLDEALQLQETGIDAITLQGVEAGGHRAIFDSQAKDPDISMHQLLEQCQSQIRIPMIAAGGIMNAADIKMALTKGASAVQLGTAFLACKEAGTSLAYRKALLESQNRKTKTTRAFSGRLARGLVNLFMNEMDQNTEAILPFPAQNKFTRDIRNAGLSDYLSLWAGTGQGNLWTGPAAELIAHLFI